MTHADKRQRKGRTGRRGQGFADVDDCSEQGLSVKGIPKTFAGQGTGTYCPANECGTPSE